MRRSRPGGELLTTFGFAGGTLLCDGSCSFVLTSCLDGCGNGIIEAGEQCEDMNGIEWDGCRDCQATEFQVNTYAPNDQTNPAVAMVADHSFVVVWQSEGPDGDGEGVFARAYDSVGVALGNEIQANTFITGDQTYPAVGMASDGRFVIAWQSVDQDGDGAGIFAQRFNAGGVPAGTEFQVNTYTTSSQSAPAVAMGTDGRFVVTWTSSGQDGDSGGVYGQRFDAVGNPVGAELRLNTHTAYNQSQPSVSMAGDWSFVAAWVDKPTSSGANDVDGRRYDPNGVPLGNPFSAPSSSYSQNAPEVDVAADGRHVVVWANDYSSGCCAIRLQRYDAVGVTTGTEIVASSTYSNSPAIALAGDGSFFVAWTNSNAMDGESYGIAGRRYDSTGNPLGAAFVVNTFTACRQYGPVAAGSTDGHYVVVWMSDPFGGSPQIPQDGSGAGIFAKRFDVNGSTLAPGQ